MSALDEVVDPSRLGRRLLGGVVAPLLVAALVAGGLLSLAGAVRGGGLVTPVMRPTDLVSAMITKMRAPDRGLVLRESRLQNLRAVAKDFGTPSQAERTLTHLHWLAGAVRAWVSRNGDDNVREQLWLFSSPTDAQTFHRDYLAANAKTVRALALAEVRRTGASVFQSGPAAATLVVHRDRFVVMVQMARSQGRVSSSQLERAARAADTALRANASTS